jgi:hypothetical protein
MALFNLLLKINHLKKNICPGRANQAILIEKIGGNKSWVKKSLH